MSVLLVPQPHLLVVDDDQDVRELLAALLTEEGYQVSQATSAAEALVQVDEQLFQGILTDLLIEPAQTPWQNIQPLLRAVRPTPVGVVTGWSVPQELLLRRGFAFVLRKPFEVTDLLDAVARLLDPVLDPAHRQQAQIIQRLFAALRQGDRLALRRLFSEDVVFYLLRPGLPDLPRVMYGWEQMSVQTQRWLRFATGWQIESFDVFLGQPDMGARFQWSLLGLDGSRERFMGSAIFRFRGERIHQIGVTLNIWKLVELLSNSAR